MKIDTASPSWIVVRQWAERRLESARVALEQAGLPPPETEYQRATVRVMRELLALATPLPEMPPSGGSYT